MQTLSPGVAVPAVRQLRHIARIHHSGTGTHHFLHALRGAERNARLKKMNQNVYEAALDLGATPFQALRKVILPEIFPGMISGFILAFTLSIDDFAVTIFTIGNQGWKRSPPTSTPMRAKVD